MKHWDVVATRFAVVLAALLLSTVCRAGDDSCCYLSSEVEYPKEGMTDVPLNPILVVGECFECWCGTSFVALQDEDGLEVPTEVAFSYDAGTCEFDVYKPISILEPDATYGLVFGDVGGVRTFTTGTSEDHDAPVIEVSEESTAQKDFVYPYVSSEELVMLTFDTTNMGWSGHIEAAPQSGTVNGYRTTAFYDRAGNKTVVEEWLDSSDEPRCGVVGPGSRERGGLFGVLVQLLVE